MDMNMPNWIPPSEKEMEVWQKRVDNREAILEFTREILSAKYSKSWDERKLEKLRQYAGRPKIGFCDERRLEIALRLVRFYEHKKYSPELTDLW